MDKSIATLIASGTAAFFSLLVFVFKVRSNKMTEFRQATRERLAPLMEESGNVLYEIVACCVLAVNESDKKNRAYYDKKASKAASKIRFLRPQLRYQLWGLDQGFRALIALSRWINEKDVSDYQLLLKLATRLRLAMDRSIRGCYLYGRTPTIYEQFIVRFYVWKMTRIWFGLKEETAFENQFRINARRKNIVKHPKTYAIITESFEKDFLAETKDGVQYRVEIKYRSGKGSRSLAKPGTRVAIYRRDNEDFYRYRFVAPGSHDRTNLSDANGSSD